MKTEKSNIVSAVLLSTLIAWILKDLLTPILFMGRGFTERSLPVKIAILVLYALIFSLIFLNFFSKLLDFLVSKFNKNKKYYILLVITITVMSLPLMSDGLIWGHDLDFHLLRIQSLRQAISHGQVPVRVNPLFLNGYGYASSLFYPDLFLYIPALFQIIGLGIEVSYKLFLIIIFILSFSAAYFCAKGISGNEYAASISAIVYCLSQYFLQNIYTRAALGELQAFIFLPFIVYGLYNLLFEEFDKKWLMAVGFIGLFFCHPVSLFMATLISFIICLCGFNKIIFNRQKIRGLIIIGIIILMSTTVFWLPLLEQMMSKNFSFQPARIQLQDTAVKLPVIFSASVLLNKTNASFGVATLVLCCLWFFTIKQSKINPKVKMINWFMIIGLILLLSVSDLFPWQFAPRFMNFIYFAWRLFGPASAFIAVAIGLIMDVLTENKFRMPGMVVVTIFMIISASWVINNSALGKIHIPQDYFQDAENTFSVGWGEEWLPSGVTITAIPRDEPLVIDNKDRSYPYTRKGQTMTMSFNRECTYIDMPFIYYKGYQAVFFDHLYGQREELGMSAEGFNHTIRVSCPQGKAGGILIVDYQGTFLQHISLWISIFSAAFCFCYILIKMHKGKIA